MSTERDYKRLADEEPDTLSILAALVFLPSCIYQVWESHFGFSGGLRGFSVVCQAIWFVALATAAVAIVGNFLGVV